MKYRMNGIGRSPLLTASLLIPGLLLAGCHERVTVIRDARIPYSGGAPGPGSLSRHPRTRTDVLLYRGT